ncbi:hypothetical protein ABH994_006300 [Bradyrhizobium yuanmingense]|uniref:hypothetical protein n=1 Tax=Bradyrhizobium yuanmingense TaxID=108015 RepID=UPI003515F6DE
MKKPIGKLVVCMCVVAATSVLAQSPRPPLEPSNRQFPKALLTAPRAIDPHSIAVSNLADKTLAFSTWDGASSWKTAQIAPGQTTIISCPRCSEVVQVSFDDGTTKRMVNANLAGQYVFYWAGSEGRWDFVNVSTITTRTPPSR